VTLCKAEEENAAPLFSLGVCKGRALCNSSEERCKRAKEKKEKKEKREKRKKALCSSSAEGSSPP
jgi:hypothetical protein